MSPTAVTYHHLEDINFWTSSTLNNILTIGNNLSSAGGGGGGCSHMEQVGMLVGNFEFDP